MDVGNHLDRFQEFYDDCKHNRAGELPPCIIDDIRDGVEPSSREPVARFVRGVWFSNSLSELLTSFPARMAYSATHQCILVAAPCNDRYILFDPYNGERVGGNKTFEFNRGEI